MIDAVGSNRDKISSRLANAGCAPRRPDVSFMEFATMEEYPDERPSLAGIAPSTAAHYATMIRQIARETTGDAQIYFAAPPDWLRIMAWRDDPARGGKARLESHRKSLMWLASWWGQGDANKPPFIRQRWNTEKNIAKAIAAGTFRRRLRFLRVPSDVSRLLHARPNEDRLLVSPRWKRPRWRAPARYLDSTWLTMVFLSVYTGCRPSELATLRLRDYQPDRGGITNWAQPKDHGKPRDVSIPEHFVWHSAVDPSIDHYLQYVRPRVATRSSPDSLFLTKTGRRWNQKVVTSFMSTCMRDVLGDLNTGGHGLRRACATFRYRHGWSIEDIAQLLDDSETVISESYLDWTWLRSLPEGTIQRRKSRPAVPRIRPGGQVDRTAQRDVRTRNWRS